MGRRTGAQSLHPVSEFADLPLQSFDRRGAHSRRGKEVAHFFRLEPDPLEGLGIDRALDKAIDLAANGADFAFKSGGCHLRIVRLQSRAQFGRHCVERAKERFPVSSLPQHFDALGQIPDGAFEPNDCVSRRQVGQTAGNSGDLNAQGGDVDGVDALIRSTQAFQPAGPRTTVVGRRVRRPGRQVDLRKRIVIARVGRVADAFGVRVCFRSRRLLRTCALGLVAGVRLGGF